MIPEVKIVIFEEKNVLKSMLELLDNQYEFIINKDLIKIDKIAKELDEAAKKLARLEIKRRNLMESKPSVSQCIEDCNDENIKQVYEEIKKILNMIELQKKANETLIKQRLFFTKKMINCIKPGKSIGTYNAYGQVGK